MQAILRLAYCTLSIALSSGCSGSPLRVPPPQQVRKQTPDAATTQPDVDEAMRKRGYKPALYRGERVYCRNETITGSNLETKVCLTARPSGRVRPADKGLHVTRSIESALF